MSLTSFILSALNGITFAGLLFLVSSGLTMIYGLLRVINVAHGSLYLLGGYLGVTLADLVGNYWLGLLGAVLGAAALALIIEAPLLRQVEGDEIRQLLVTLGLSLVASSAAIAVFGGDPRIVRAPDYLSESITVGGITYPTFRLFALGVSLLVAVLLVVLLERSRVGALIRAGVDDAETVEALGVNVGLLFLGVLLLGSALAGLGGFIGGSVLGLAPGIDNEVLLLSFAVVILGGLGSLSGAMLGSVVIGLLTSFGQALVPQFAAFLVFVPMLMVLVVRPRGLLGRAA